jgi:phosphoglycerate kinase
MKNGEILLLENLRQQYDLEKANDEGFAKSLASLGDIYVNDAFSNSHRAHASMVGIPKILPSFAGFLLRDEVKNLQEALHPPKPALAIIGGAKFETKDPLIRSFLEIYDHVAVVGAIANDVLKAQGHPVAPVYPNTSPLPRW